MTTSPDILDLSTLGQHELVQFCRDTETGLSAVIAVHSTALGPALGGCRMWPYGSVNEAVSDVLRLSRGMSYKNALAGLPMGGGKAVIIGDPHCDKSPALFKAFGRFVDSLGGHYITAEDAGITVEDMEIAATQTRHVAGLASGKAGSGDPSPWTALGVFRGIQAAVQHRLGTDSLNGLTVSVQGLGHVGFALASLLRDAGALVIASDIHAPNVRRALNDLGVQAVDQDAIFSVDADIFAPCAMGAAINDENLGRLSVRIVAGAANNQLAFPRHGEELRQRGILYAPDYVINAGGVISVAAEVLGNANRATLPARMDEIGTKLGEIFLSAERLGQPTNAVADVMAEQIITAGQGSRSARARTSRAIVA